MGNFEIKDNFYLDGKPFQIISGAIHYFRIVPEYWKDRLEKLKAMGCNTVETYIPWNMHEPKKGEFHFEGMLDIERFIKTAQDLGLYVILRPSPYICAEWEFGGLPAWLLAEDGMKLRVSYPPFLKHVQDYYDVLLKKIVPYQINYGGPVILMQVENEYGYYANDREYLLAMKDKMQKGGVVVPLVTSDGPFEENLNGGHLEGALPTGNFGSKTEERFEVLKKYTDGGPLMCTEFWVGWFDHWGNGGHMTGNLEESVKDLDKMLELGHVNIYMFEGGTNFGFMNGSNYYDELTPDVTSYDYDALLTEDGQITEKYRRYRDVIAKYREIPEVTFTTEIKRKAYGTLQAKEKVSLFSVLDDLSAPVESSFPQSMEKLGQNYGYILYHSTLDTEEKLEKLRLWEANDRANIFVDQKPVMFFANIKRGGILLIQMSVGALYMFSVPRGYADGFNQWCKQVIAICLTAFLQTTLLYLGLITFSSNMLMGLGIMLAADEVPKIAQTFGLDSSVRVNMMSVVHATTTAVNLTRGVAKAV